ncbi:hypothetical protein C8F04DRAFT_1193112 [Mycena alexandri]|uniref:Uncharacterized protein n=1 Tax=Mycena alexandri TaxID=1745969 RepID=A0AAD6SAA7_9AGAR|nr:hypothetical protein C8F04DRAFT_1193112 [Mycena alexandri]
MCSATALTAVCSAGGISCTNGGTCCSKICSGNLCTPGPGDPCTPSGGVCFPGDNICCSKVCDANQFSATANNRKQNNFRVQTIGDGRSRGRGATDAAGDKVSDNASIEMNSGDEFRP